MADLMTAIADIVSGIAGFMEMNISMANTAGFGAWEAWYFALAGISDQVMLNLSTLMSGLGEILNSLAGLFGGGHPV